MRIYWRRKPLIISVTLAMCMLRLAVWQWDRHLQKQAFIHTMEQRLTLEPAALASIVSPTDPYVASSWEPFLRRRVLISGTYDFAHEVVLRNRRLDGAPGVYAITPLKLDDTNPPITVLVNRGFIPLSRSNQDLRKEYQRPLHDTFTALLKESTPARWLSPEDPPSGLNLPWVDAWLRVDVPRIAAQLPYPVLPINVEIMDGGPLSGVERKIVRSDHGREELLFLGAKEMNVGRPDVRPDLTYPVPAFDAVIPPGRHLGYVWEWTLMAIMTVLIGLVVQLRPARTARVAKYIPEANQNPQF